MTDTAAPPSSSSSPSDAESASDAASHAIRAALRAPLPRFYANSFVNAVSDADIMTVLQCNGQNVCIFNFNYVLAKTYAKALIEAVAEYEKRNSLTVPVIDVVR
jgi:pyridoxal biosynthesis lyase PdxS